MFKVSIRPRWELSSPDAAEFLAEGDMTRLLALLSCIEQSGSINKACDVVGLSYRYAWGLLQEAERTFGQQLLSKSRGRGTTLMPFAEKLLWAEKRVLARLSPTLDSLASELELELQKVVSQTDRVLRINASHGFAVASLLEFLNARDMSIDLKYRNSSEALAALSRKECDLAGFHIPIGEFQSAAMAKYAQWLNSKDHCLIHLAVRNLGLFVAPGNPKRITQLNDLVRPDVRFANRQIGSGTRMLMELMLAKAGINIKAIAGYESTEFTHAAVAAYIGSGMADVGFGVETAARRFGLDFLPLVRERYFFSCRRDAVESALIQEALNVMRGPEFRSSVAGLAGYDPGQAGELLFLDGNFD